MVTLTEMEDALARVLFPHGEVDRDLIREALKFLELKQKQKADLAYDVTFSDTPPITD